MRPARAFDVGLGLAFCAAVGFRWSIAGRGLDFTDESFALLAARHPGEMRAWPSLFFDYTAPLMSLAGADIGTVRRLGLLLFLAAGAVLVWGIRVWARGAVDSAAARRLFAIVSLGTLVYYSRGVSVPNYNQLVACGLMVGLGLLLVALRANGWRSGIAMIGAGFAIGVAAASKPPAVVALFLAAGWVMAALRSAGPVAWLLVGAAIAWAIPLASHSLRECLEILETGIRFSVVREPRYSPGDALATHARQAGQLLLQTVGYLALPLLAGWTAARRKLPFAWLLALSCLLTVLALDGSLLGGRSAARSGRTTAAIMAAIVVGAAPGRDLLARLRRAGEGPILTALILLPVIGVLGTNTNFSSALLLFMGPWFVVVPVCLLHSAGGPAERAARSAFPALIAAFASTSAPYTSPYGLTAPFAEQTHEVSIGQPPTRIVTDRQTARFLARLEAAARACGFSPGQDIIPLLEMPGFVFALGGVSLGTAYYPRDGVGLAEGIPMVLATVPEERVRRSYVLLNDNVIRLGPLSIAGRRVPDDYEVCFDRDGPSKYGDMRVRLLKPPGAVAPPLEKRSTIPNG